MTKIPIYTDTWTGVCPQLKFGMVPVGSSLSQIVTLWIKTIRTDQLCIEWPINRVRQSIASKIRIRIRTGSRINSNLLVTDWRTHHQWFRTEPSTLLSITYGFQSSVCHRERIPQCMRDDAHTFIKPIVLAPQSSPLTLENAAHGQHKPA